MRSTLSPLLTALLATALVACPDPVDPAPVEPLAFGEIATAPRAAFMSVGGTGPEDVWLVGAQPGLFEEPVVLRRRGGDWEEVSTGVLHAMWWVHAFEGGPTFIGGGGATVLRVDGDVVTRTPTPAFFGNTVYGVWGASPDDVWAVGGFAGRSGFAWRYDGATWTDVPLPDDLPRGPDGELASLFKVWGRSADDVWAVGNHGAVLHFDGDAWAVVPSGTHAALFTVTGDDDEVVIVGGLSQGVVLRGGLEGLVADSPATAPLLQGVTLDAEGAIWVAGAFGYAAVKRPGSDAWEPVDLGLEESPQSVHALWFDGVRDVWGVGGGVLSPALDTGVACTSAPVDRWVAPSPPEIDTACPEHLVDPFPDHSIARRWMEQTLNSIRRDIPHPPKHARNLHHVTAAIYDAWATYDEYAVGVVTVDRHDADDVEAAREIAISYAAYRVLAHRYADAIGAETSLDCYDRFMDVLGLDPLDLRIDGDDPVAVGNRVGEAVIVRYLEDGANELGGLADTTGWEPTNPVMIVDRPGTNVQDPDLWQQLNLGTAETQNGIVLDDSVQPYIGPQWREVEPFALSRDPETGLYSLPGELPTVHDPEMADWVVEVIRRTAELDVGDGVTFDASPGSIGNNSLGADDGQGHAVNPVTGEPYAPNVVRRGDFTRVVAEMWADGPASETPPGHWMRIALEVGDALTPEERLPFGDGPAVDRLAWDVQVAMVMGGAVHDAAISAWELKRDTLGPRPITLVRWMGQKGQRSDPALPSYDPDGLPLVPGLIELITEASSAPGEPHFHLRGHLGEIAVWSWPGEPGDRVHQHTPLQWMRAKDWIPYQRRTFVTPAFPGYTSGHSTFSRASAEALTAFTGSPFFPGGLHEWVAYQGEYLVFESGPSEDLRLQWATYYDAADQSGQSRIWGGIHIWPDDRWGRINGARVGELAAARAATLIYGDPR